MTYDRYGTVEEPLSVPRVKAALAPRGVRAGYALVRPYQAGDYVVLHGLCSQDAGKPLAGDPWEVGKAYETMGPAFTVEGSTIHAALGLVIHWPGRAVGWAILAPACRRDRRLGVWMRNEVRQRLPGLIREHGIRRLEADVHASGYGIAWVRSLGFEVESLMPGYGADGADFFKFVRITDA